MMSASNRGSRSIIPEHPRIALAPEVLAGKLFIRGTRISVELVIGLRAATLK